jgi:hypothetical protein
MNGEGELKRPNKPLVYGYFENNKLIKERD